MNEKWAQFREKLLGFWNQYSNKRKWVLASTAICLLIAVILLISILTRTEYEVAFQNLDSTDAAAVIDYLEGQGISYKLSADGTSISVPSAAASRVKVGVGSQGLIQNGSMGFKELSQSSSSIGTTQEEFQVKYLNALNGEVQQLLQSKHGVQRAKVLITLPRESVFVRDADREQAQASVTLTFMPGFRPTQEEIDSYFNLVRTAVPNLSLENITISSTTGGDLLPSSELGGSGSSGLIQQQLQSTREFENEIRRKIQSFLGPMVGIDNMVVSVVATLNFDRRVTEANNVLPLPGNDNRGIIISEQRTSETVTGTGGGVGGIAGTGETDIANYPGTLGTSSTSTSERTSDIVNYEPSRVRDVIEAAPYKVQDVAINVGIDSSVVSPEQAAAYEQMLVSNVRTLLADSGLELTDDQLTQRVSVISQTFKTGEPQPSGLLAVPAYWLAAVGLLAAALLGGGGYYVYRRRKAARQAEELAAAEAQKVQLPTIDIDNVSSENQIRKQLESLAKRKPDEFVNLLRTWLVDE